MRGAAALPTPRPLAPALPALYQEDDFTTRFVSGFDEVLAPVFSALDNFPSYIDPALTPEDFLSWLNSWVGLAADERMPLEQRRAFVKGAVEVYRWLGTVRGLRAHIALLTGHEPEIEESGGVASSTEAGGALPGSEVPRLVVRVGRAAARAVGESELRRIVAASRPAHIPFEVEVATR
jgi:phage tail-like protein